MPSDELSAASGDFEVGDDHAPLSSRKESLECELLEAQIRNERKPRYARAGWLLSALATVAGIAGVLIQWTHSTRDLQLAELKQERAELAQEKAEQAAADAIALWKSYQDKIGESQRRLVELKEEQEAVQELIEASLRLVVEEARVGEKPPHWTDMTQAIDPGAAVTTPRAVELNHVREQLVEKRQAIQAQIQQTPSFEEPVKLSREVQEQIEQYKQMQVQEDR